MGVAGLVIGLLLLFLASGGAAKAGFVIALVAVLFILTGRVSLGRGGGLAVLRGRPDLFRGPRVDPEPEYIEETAEPSEEVWEHERERHRDKQRRK